MVVAMIYAIITIVWVLSVVFAFVLGYWSNGKEKRLPEAKEPTSEDLKAIEKMRKEYENFMAYDGTPQNAINGE